MHYRRPPPRKAQRKRDYKHEGELRSNREGACRHLFSSTEDPQERRTGSDRYGNPSYTSFRTCLLCGARVSLKTIERNPHAYDWTYTSAEEYRAQKKRAAREEKEARQNAERARKQAERETQGIAGTAGKGKSRARMTSEERYAECSALCALEC